MRSRSLNLQSAGASVKPADPYPHLSDEQLDELIADWLPPAGPFSFNLDAAILASRRRRFTRTAQRAA